MTIPDAIGFGGATCTTLAFVPQVLKIWRTRSVNDISLTMYLVFFIGLVQWLIYGILLDSWPMILSNIVTIALAGAVLLMKVRFRE